MSHQLFGDPSPKQLASFKESDAKINIWEGAVRSGKTYISLWRFIVELSNGPEGDYAIICRTYQSFKRNVLKMMEDMIGIRDVGFKAGNQMCNIFGKTVHIVGADDERAESKIRGPTFAGAYVDEATIIPESVFKMLISRCAMHDAKIFVTTNPDSPFHWLKTDFLENNPDVKSWQFTLDDNPELSDKNKEYLKRQYKGLWYQRFIEGLWVQAEGAVYDFFEERLHVIDFAPNYNAQYYVGVDYGVANPCAFVMIGHDKTKFPQYWVEKEYYYDSKIHQRQKSDSEYGKDLASFIEGKNVRAIYIDPSASSFKVELGRIGITNVHDAINEVGPGINFVSNMFNNGTLKIVRCCKNVIKEMQSYVWDQKKGLQGKDEPKKANDHSLDALRYALYTPFFGSSGNSYTSKDIQEMFLRSKGHSPQQGFFGQEGLRDTMFG